MARFFAVLAITCLALASCGASNTRQERVAHLAPHVYKIEALTASGTGFQMQLPNGRRYIVTARHVCDAAIFNTLFINGRAHQVLRKSKTSDLCLLEPTKRRGGLVLAARAPRPFDFAYSMGHPGGYEVQYYEGFGSGKMSVGPNVWADAYSFSAAGGQSGSPVLGSDGRVIGLVAWQFRLTGQAMAVQWDDLRRFLWEGLAKPRKRRTCP